jgi:hypothetical protein
MIVAQPSDSGTSEIRSLRFRRNDRGELLAEVELVSRDHWKELIAAIEVTLLDQANAPCGSAGATRTFHVEDSIYDARGITLDFGPVSLAQPRAVQVGLNTAVIGEMMGRTRMMFLADSPLFPPEVLLRSDDRAVWSYGLAALNRYLREQVLRGGSLLPEKGQPLGSPSALALRDYRDRLAVLLTRAGDVDDLVLLCRLAGYTQDARLIEPLAGLLSHEDQGVQDAAAIGLGLLGDARGRQRILAIIERPSADQGPSVGASSSCGTTPEMR